MAEKMSEVFEMYDVRLDHIGRGRGAMLLQTDKGVRQIRATTAGEKRLQAEYDFKEHMYLAGFPHIDRLVKNVEDELITYDRYGNPFVMRMFFDGREMGVSNKNTIIIVSLYVGQPMRAISQRLILKNIISGTSCRICIISFGKPWKKMDMRLHCSLRS